MEIFGGRATELEGLRSALKWPREAIMAQMTPQASEVLEKALALSTQERGMLIDSLSKVSMKLPRKTE